MSTGITSVANLPELAAMYPFAGFEWLFTLIVVAFTVIFIMKQIAMDKDESAEAATSPIPATTIAPAE
ncbi:hypothetical protein [Chenggangzhangella methanolivorans]|uniref:Uncharacterized protein n=1 Tax=Chenggangzhangella methanolivorans TaxID=1437009 RepID=A0A9E6RDS9_9HYPH|nr:hypothetical protein [Chenggangzhangella methanolivorans]QZO02560.1 hypothetical protein K6K41_21360 [Chenggangzhangella methanolivorans]